MFKYYIIRLGGWDLNDDDAVGTISSENEMAAVMVCHPFLMIFLFLLRSDQVPNRLRMVLFLADPSGQQTESLIFPMFFHLHLLYLMHLFSFPSLLFFRDSLFTDTQNCILVIYLLNDSEISRTSDTPPQILKARCTK